jgi:hypothetical protein
MVTPYVWMFIKSNEKLRENILANRTISSLIQLEYNAFEAACVPVCAFTLRNFKCNISGEFIKLSNFKGIEMQAPKTLEAVNNRNCGYRFTVYQENFSKIPSMPIAYWIGKSFLDVYDRAQMLGDAFPIKKGNDTGENDIFVRNWYEVELNKIGFTNYNKSWIPYIKSGEARKWYGNLNWVVFWEQDGQLIKNHPKSTIRNPQFNFCEGITWSDLTSRYISARYMPQGCLRDNRGPAIFNLNEQFNYVLALLCSKICLAIQNIINPTICFQVGNAKAIPYIFSEQTNQRIMQIVQQCISISRKDWNFFETSWDFKRHPLIRKYNRISDCFVEWQKFTEQQFNQLKANEEDLNRIFIEIYDLQDELTSEVEDEDITIRKAEIERDIKSFISYAVGCMFGRYSLDVEGLAYAGGEWDYTKYKTFIPDGDNILPITDNEYFEDDIVTRFVEFVKKAYGSQTLEENLDFIASVLVNKGNTSREIIRNYFLNDFYKDHCNIYTSRGAGKRPIYWLFDSGKENGFKALIYLHRYDEDTVGRVRVDYLHKTQAAIENAIAHCNVILESNIPASEKAKAVKKKEKLVKQLVETRIYDQAVAHIAHQRIALDLDNGVVVNYAKFQGVFVSREGKKAVKVDLLGKI